MSETALPPLTGSALFDPWRLRLREKHGLQPGVVPARRPTRSEILLWEALQRTGQEWVAEFPTRYGYTLDFYCPAVRLAVEVDGSSHWGEAKREKDAWRDVVHERMGIQTKRFSAREVETDTDWVVREISVHAERRLASLVGPSSPALPADAGADESVENLDGDERLLTFPPEPTGWSAYLPACRTVLPEQPRTLRQRLSWRPG